MPRYSPDVLFHLPPLERDRQVLGTLATEFGGRINGGGKNDRNIPRRVADACQRLRPDVITSPATVLAAMRRLEDGNRLQVDRSGAGIRSTVLAVTVVGCEPPADPEPEPATSTELDWDAKRAIERVERKVDRLLAELGVEL